MRSCGGGERVVRRRLADGTVKEYRYRKDRTARRRYDPGTVAALILAYKASPEWGAHRPATVKNYGIYLRDMEELAHRTVAEIRRKDLLILRDAIAKGRGTGAANVFAKVAAVLFGWARDRGWIEHSPADRLRALPGGHLLAWTAAEANKAIAELPAPLQRVVILGRYTGQRRGDLIAMTWRAYDGTVLRVRQQKTGAALLIPVHPALKGPLEAWKREAASTHILTTETGIPWSANHLSYTMKIALAEIGMRRGLNVHGLRKLAAAELAEAGCSAHEIAAITGHKTLAMVQLYTASVDQGRLAEAAIVRLQNASAKRSENG